MKTLIVYFSKFGNTRKLAEAMAETMKQAGDARAWKELVNRYQALVYTIALRVGLSMADAADCFQQSWVALYEHRKRIKDPERVAGWLATTARREAIRVYRRNLRQSDLPDDDRHIDPSALPDEELELLERQAHLENGMTQLDSRCRRLIELLFLAPEDWSYEQIAEKLEIAPNSLGPIRQRCLERLRKILSD